MNTYGNDFQKSAKATAKTFVDEFPSEIPSLSWLAEAASIEHVPDTKREKWFQAVCDAVKELQRAMTR